jgi:outer membrane beta-barrel protein
MNAKCLDVRRFFLVWVALGWWSALEAADYQKATEGRDVVMGKLYPKSERLEADADLGFIMNQSYVNTLLLGVGGTYYLSENFGLGLNFQQASNSDKPERTCIESFYYDPKNQVGVACGDRATLESARNNNDRFPLYGPAYVPIREIQNIIGANILWAPVYGKQLLLLSSTSYFDLFFELGLGLVSSVFYEKQEILRNGNAPRGTYQTGTRPEDTAANAKIGALPNETNSYGIDGRPDPISNSNVMLNLGLGQKFHFGKMFHIKLFVRNMTLLGTEDGFDNLLALYGGVGLRF